MTRKFCSLDKYCEGIILVVTSFCSSVPVAQWVERMTGNQSRSWPVRFPLGTRNRLKKN